MKKSSLIQWMALLLTGALLLGFAACGDRSKEPATEPPETTIEEPTTEEPTTPVSVIPGFWSIEIRGVPNTYVFTSEDAKFLPKVEVEMSTTNVATGTTSKYKYGGVTLRSLLSFITVQNVSYITVSSQSSSVTYSAAMAMAEDTILAWEIDGALIDADIPLRMCPKSGTAELFVSQVTSLNIVVSLEPPTTTYADPPTGNNSQPPWSNSTQKTTWPTYESYDPPTMPPQTDADGNVITTEPTTDSTTSTYTTSKITSSRYRPEDYTAGPTQPTTTTTTTSSTKPPWWPSDVTYD